MGIVSVEWENFILLVQNVSAMVFSTMVSRVTKGPSEVGSSGKNGSLQ